MDSATQPASYPMSRACPLDPPAEYRTLRAEEPIRRVRLDFDGSSVWLVTRYADARAVLDDVRFSSDFSTPGFPARLTSQPPGPGTFIRMDPPDQLRLRKLVGREFSKKRAEEMRPAVQRIVDELIDRMIAGPPPADLIAELALPLPSRVITELLGVPYSDQEFFHKATTVMGDQKTPPERRLQVRNELKSYLDELVARKEKEPADDLLSRMAAGREAADVSHEEVVGIATLLMVAGYETVANQIGVGTVALWQQPEKVSELREHADRVPVAVEEIVRHQTVIDYGARRAATEDVQVGGQLIRAGDGLVVVLASANRDDAVFDRSDELDFGRDHNEHLSFGYGFHGCVGQFLARVQLQVTWSTLIRRIPTLRLAVPLEEIPFRFDMFVYGVHRLPVTW